MIGSVRRGCGLRIAGGIYLVTKLSTHGTPLQYFLIDPPWVPVDEDGTLWKPKARGLTVEARPGVSGVHDVYDWVGADGYPFFPDFYEEGRRFEFSRRAEPGLPYELLNKNSWHFYMHPKGMPVGLDDEQLAELYNSRLPGTGIEVCPLDKEYHMSGQTREFCTGLLWQLVDSPQSQGDRMHTVLMPRDTQDMFSYLAAAPPDWWTPNWIPAILLKLPIHGIEIVADPLSDQAEENYEIVMSSGTSLPVEIVQE